jgi:hypothetical protein
MYTSIGRQKPEWVKHEAEAKEELDFQIDAEQDIWLMYS